MATDNGNGTVTVVKGDTLYAISSKYYKTYGYSSITTYMNHLADINNIANVNYITIGQVIKLTGSSSTSTNSTVASRVTISRNIGLLSGSSDTLYIQWEWAKHEETEKYELEWYRSWDLQGIALCEEASTTMKYATYSAPSEVVNSSTGKVSVRIKPVAKTTRDSDGNETTPWTASWSTIEDEITRYFFSTSKPADTPSAPSVELKDYMLTAELTGIPDYVEQVDFKCIKNNMEQYGSIVSAIPSTGYASASWAVDLGNKYKVCARYVRGGTAGDWSEYSGNSGTEPSTPTGIIVCRAESKTSVYLEWDAAVDAESYTVEYTTDVNYFDKVGNLSTVTTKNTSCLVTGLDSGDTYYFRVRAENGNGESSWTAPVSVVIGTAPAAPTTWSSTTTVIVGEELIFYWVHNSKDDSFQSSAEIELTIDGSTTVETITTPGTGEEDEDDERTMHYSFSTSGYKEGCVIEWRVRTAGVTGEYGDWSVKRTVTVYAKPSLWMNVTDITANSITTLRQFPAYVTGEAGPKTQKPVGYHLSVTSNSYYETVDEIGNRKIVNAGTEVYSKYFDISDYTFLIELSAGNIDLENNITYTVKCIVSMDSGLTGEATCDFTVAWTDEIYEPNAEIGIDKESVTTIIRPYCKDENGDYIENVTLSVYRREFDGSFTKLITGIDNTKNTFITDPHPALDYARYRIVAISKITGAVSYYDMPGYKVGEISVIMQWDEVWSTFDVTSDYVLRETTWSGSMLKLPYNIDVSYDHAPDVSLVEYIGRNTPVSYYGTQLGHTASWSVDIPKTDKETLYAIRRLASWLGDVYVREPSGIGYWANVTISYSKKHLDTIIPIKINITRVSGGA